MYHIKLLVRRVGTKKHYLTSSEAPRLLFISNFKRMDYKSGIPPPYAPGYPPGPQLPMVPQNDSFNRMDYQAENPPPYAPGYRPSPQPAVVLQNVTPTVFGPHSQNMMCPSCHAVIFTKIRSENTTKTHFMALLLLIICCPLVCLPYCMDSCQAINHYCPSCGAYLGSYDK